MPDPALRLTGSFLHALVVKEIDGPRQATRRWIIFNGEGADGYRPEVDATVDEGREAAPPFLESSVTESPVAA